MKWRSTIAPKTESVERVDPEGRHSAVIKNPPGVFPATEMQPLAELVLQPPPSPAAILVPLEGVLLNTDVLMLRALEDMLREMSGLYERSEWVGMDLLLDVPNIAGGGITHGIDYVIQKYANFIQPHYYLRALLKAAIECSINEPSSIRMQDIRGACKAAGILHIYEGSAFRRLAKDAGQQVVDPDDVLDKLLEPYTPETQRPQYETLTRAGTQIYLTGYKKLLQNIEAGGEEDRQLVSLMSDAATFLALVKGAAGAAASNLTETLCSNYKQRLDRVCNEAPENITSSLAHVGKAFTSNPPLLGVACSAVENEAQALLRVMKRLLLEETAALPLPESAKESFAQAVSSNTFIDAKVTTTDTGLLRQKPHRDPYTQLLQRLGLHAGLYKTVIGIEENEDGVIALRGAGIGRTIALPYSRVKRFNPYCASAYVDAGFTGLLLKASLLLPPPAAPEK